MHSRPCDVDNFGQKSSSEILIRDTKVLKFLADGTWQSVFLATHPANPAGYIVLKLIIPGVLDKHDWNAIGKMRQESSMWFALNASPRSPSFPQLYLYAAGIGRDCLVNTLKLPAMFGNVPGHQTVDLLMMEFKRGGEKPDPVRNPEAFRRYAKSLTRGLAHSQGRGVSFCDIKPGNINWDNETAAFVDLNVGYFEDVATRRLITGSYCTEKRVNEAMPSACTPNGTAKKKRREETGRNWNWAINRCALGDLQKTGIMLEQALFESLEFESLEFRRAARELYNNVSCCHCSDVSSDVCKRVESYRTALVINARPEPGWALACDFARSMQFADKHDAEYDGHSHPGRVAELLEHPWFTSK